MEEGQDKYFYVQSVPFEPAQAEGQEGEGGNENADQDFIAAARKVFEKIDSNQSGEISVVELGSALHSAGYLVPNDKLAEIIDSFDKDESGTMGFDEFLNFLSQFRQQE